MTGGEGGASQCQQQCLAPARLTAPSPSQGAFYGASQRGGDPRSGRSPLKPNYNDEVLFVYCVYFTGDMKRNKGEGHVGCDLCPVPNSLASRLHGGIGLLTFYLQADLHFYNTKYATNYAPETKNTPS
ncbi:hypothetical protein E2C01_063581 [Portunus trituberculatus]|uniref:Uncharacterized protein n=1 Tax=Portunus trituberculatus TaxID=210409 RepID=A0A5B7HKV5_PORTR|nr:hypothetical protein [Portunus trituberculatus]